MSRNGPHFEESEYLDWLQEAEVWRIRPETRWERVCRKWHTIAVGPLTIIWMDIELLHGSVPKFGRRPAAKRYGLELQWRGRALFTTWKSGRYQP